MTELHKSFKRSVSKIVNARRMWDVLWNELDKAEETTLMAKYKMKLRMMHALADDDDSKDGKTREVKDDVPDLPSPTLSNNEDDQGDKVGDLRKSPATPATTPASPSGSDSKSGSILNLSLGVDGLVHSTSSVEVLPTSPRSFKAKLSDRVMAADTYTNVKGASNTFLTDLSRTQNRTRNSTAFYANSGRHRDYEIAELPPLEDDTILTPEWVTKMIQEFKKEKILSYQNAFQIARRAIKSMIHLPNVVEVHIPKVG